MKQSEMFNYSVYSRLGNNKKCCPRKQFLESGSNWQHVTVQLCTQPVASLVQQKKIVVPGNLSSKLDQTGSNGKCLKKSKML